MKAAVAVDPQGFRKEDAHRAAAKDSTDRIVFREVIRQGSRRTRSPFEFRNIHAHHAPARSSADKGPRPRKDGIRQGSRCVKSPLEFRNVPTLHAPAKCSTDGSCALPAELRQASCEACRRGSNPRHQGWIPSGQPLREVSVRVSNVHTHHAPARDSADRFRALPLSYGRQLGRPAGGTRTRVREINMDSARAADTRCLRIGRTHALGCGNARRDCAESSDSTRTISPATPTRHVRSDHDPAWGGKPPQASVAARACHGRIPAASTRIHGIRTDGRRTFSGETRHGRRSWSTDTELWAM